MTHVKSWIAAAAVVVVMSWAGPALAMTVSLTATPVGSVCQGGAVALTAVASNLPTGTASVKYNFTVNRASDNGFEPPTPTGFTASPTFTWTPGTGAFGRSPFNLWVVANALGANGQVLAGTPASISGYRVQNCALSVRLFPKPETSVKVNCQATLYATASPSAPPSGQHYEYRFYVQRIDQYGGTTTVPNACPSPPTARLCNWRPTQVGQYVIGVEVRRMGSSSTPLETAHREFTPYQVQTTGACP